MVSASSGGRAFCLPLSAPSVVRQSLRGASCPGGALLSPSPQGCHMGPVQAARPGLWLLPVPSVSALVVHPPIRASHALVSAPQEPFLAPRVPSNSLTPLQDCIIHTVLRNIFLTDILSIAELQCCVNFYCRAKSLSYTYTHSFPLQFIAGS